MTVDIETQMAELRYLIQDLDAQIASKDIADTQICSARQLAEIHESKNALLRQRNLFRMKTIELERNRQIAVRERDQAQDQHHQENKRLSLVGVCADIVGAVVGIKSLRF